MPILFLLVSYIPALLIFFFLRGLHKDDEEYKKDCNKCLLDGAVFSSGVIVLSGGSALLLYLTGLEKSHPMLALIIHNFIVIALAEEFLKYWTANRTIKKNKNKNSWLDVISYMTIAAIGFEFLESAVYMFTTSPGQILVRGVLAMHTAMALFTGYFLGKAEYTGKRGWFWFGFILMTLDHGGYDFGLKPEVEDTLWWLSVTLAGITFIILIVMLIKVAKARKDPKYTTPFSEMWKITL